MGTLSVVRWNTNREIKTGENTPVISGFYSEALNQVRECAYSIGCRSGVAPVRAEDGLGTPSVCCNGAPVGVVYDVGFNHE